ncbi:RNA polymerase sigma factor [Neolewinella agarilytica]|uniref:RNA polymerase sigma-70 factor, ECF subfamily n=1 Tax=Neolewinella agarilytica TaxID=478744 RepID=A0A1H9AKN2_9BACT|nr:sigma-70 family RNA polymerase sigma factor [Neolewinella agarilytica]SEP76508.1 RNA polymerase sigma-70 factor, ECF subfamily [Neolewinella agarilytica]
MSTYQTNKNGANYRNDMIKLDFPELVSKYDSQVSAILNRYTSCSITLDEIKQKAFIKAYEKRSHYRGEASFGTWLFTIVRTVALDYLSRQKRREENRQRYGKTLPRSGSLDQKMNQLDAASIRDAVRALPKADAILLDLHYFQQRDIREIAIFLDCTPSHIRTKLSRARARAKTSLQKYFGQELNDLCPGWCQKDMPQA